LWGTNEFGNMVMRDKIKQIMHNNLTVLNIEGGYVIRGVEECSEIMSEYILEEISEFIPTLEYSFNKLELKEMFELWLKTRLENR
jgi:predicted house-cleaning noncanonical NTP pyrophosphatase (MazG superfamily)